MRSRGCSAKGPHRSWKLYGGKRSTMRTGSSPKWGKLADSFGWSPGDLFDVPRDGAMGLVWWLKGRSVTALGPVHAGVGQPAYDRVTHRDWVNPYSRPVRPVSLSPILERQRDITRRLFPGRLDERSRSR
jgi:hypothetical protein